MGGGRLAAPSVKRWRWSLIPSSWSRLLTHRQLYPASWGQDTEVKSCEMTASDRSDPQPALILFINHAEEDEWKRRSRRFSSVDIYIYKENKDLIGIVLHIHLQEIHLAFIFLTGFHIFDMKSFRLKHCRVDWAFSPCSSQHPLCLLHFIPLYIPVLLF